MTKGNINRSSWTLYRWMVHVTKALNDSTIRNKFFREHANMASELLSEFEESMGVRPEHRWNYGKKSPRPNYTIGEKHEQSRTV